MRSATSRTCDEALLERPRRTVLNPDWRVGGSGIRFAGAADSPSSPTTSSARSSPSTAQIGMAFGAADYAHDVRLACHGLDRDDNDFVIGLIGKDLFPLSAVVQVMRKTQQTSLYLDRLGPFFVGRKVAP